MPWARSHRSERAVFICAEQLVDSRFQRRVFRRAKQRVPFENLLQRGLRLLDDPHIGHQICNLKPRKAGLTVAEELARTAQLQIPLADFEPVVGPGHDIQPFGRGARIRI